MKFKTGLKTPIKPLILLLSLSLAGCSSGLWNTKSKIDEHELSQFGQKKVLTEIARGNDDFGSAAAEGMPSMFTFGTPDGLLSSGKPGPVNQRFEKLFSAALDVVMDLPVKVASKEGGFIATDWKQDPNSPQIRYRLNIRVSGQAPYGQVKVSVLKQAFNGGHWNDQAADTKIARHIEKAIRKRAGKISTKS
ncbi:DUF3576 domain-containing protein [Magnetococcales bacterium HHB-1]